MPPTCPIPTSSPQRSPTTSAPLWSRSRMSWRICGRGYEQRATAQITTVLIQITHGVSKPRLQPGSHFLRCKAASCSVERLPEAGSRSPGVLPTEPQFLDRLDLEDPIGDRAEPVDGANSG